MNPANTPNNRLEGIRLLLALLLSAVLLPNPAQAEEPARLRTIRPLFQETEIQPESEPASPTGAVSAYREHIESPAAVPEHIRNEDPRPPVSDLLSNRPSAPLAAVEREETNVEVEEVQQENPQPIPAIAPVEAAPSESNAELPAAGRRPEVGRRLDDLAMESEQQRRPLASFLEDPDPIRLRRTSAAYTFDIPVSSRMEVTAGEAEIRYTNSISLRQDISQLAVSWNDHLLAQVPLMVLAPNGRIRETLPGTPFESGYLPLRIDVAQHYARNNECEDPSSPVLWTQIDPAESWISMDYHLRPLDPVLSDLAELIDPKLWEDYELTVVTSPSYTTDDNRLRWGALVAQRAALLLDFKPLDMRHATQLHRKGDQVVIGTRNELQDILPETLLTDISESFIGIYPNPLAPEYFVLVLSGYDTASVDRAVTAMALYNEALPATTSMDVSALQIPESAPYQTDRVLLSREKLDFSELGFETDTRMGMGAEAYQVEFRIPPDMYAPENASVDFRMHFAHGAKLREDSVFNVLLNGQFESAIYLQEEGGAVYRDYRVEIPLRSFRPGKNRIEFQPQMVPAITGHCEMIQEENLLFTLFDDSNLKMPAADHYVRLPDLQLFGWTGFPSTMDSAGEGFTIHVASPDSETMAAAWMMAGKLAQIVGQPLVDLEVSGDVPESDRHWIGVGTIADMPTELLAGAPVQFGENGRIPSILSRIPADRAGLKQERRRVEGNRTSLLEGSTSAGNKGVLMQFESPLAAGRSGMLVTAEDRVTLRQRVSELIQPGVWGGLGGDTMIWYGTGSDIRSQRLGDSFYLGDPGVSMAAAYHLSENPWLGIALAIAGVFLLAIFAKRALAKFHRRHHNAVRPKGQAAPAVEPG